jgi:choline dehydrogenase-like flavoprotein
MLTDIAALEDGRLRADVCIVGAGAAGLTIARELESLPIKTVVLEAGRGQLDAEAQELYRSDVVGLPHDGALGYRFRGLGGSTAAWAGQVAPFTDIDFGPRPWIPATGWPISRDELEPDYRRVAELVGVPPFRRDDAMPDAIRPAVDFDPELLEPCFTEFAPQPDFWAIHGTALSASTNLTVITGAGVVELVADDQGSSIDLVRASSLGGERLDVEASFVVLCGGGIETARILLASQARSEAGVGNDHDLVGRCFQDHPGFVVGSFKPRDRGLVQEFAPRRVDGLKYSVRARVPFAVQRGEGLPHVGAGLVFDLAQRPSVAAGKLLLKSARMPQLRREVPSALGAVARDPLPLARAAFRYFVRHGVALDTSIDPVLAVGGEQIPNPESRVRLVEDRDRLGVKRIAIDWRLTELDLSAYRRAAELAADAFERAGVGSVDLNAFDLPLDPEEVAEQVVDNGHHMGTTRMATSPEDGVVDPDCKVFGVDNLYIGSLSVLPTGGFSTPTFTTLALCLRIARTLAGRT